MSLPVPPRPDVDVGAPAASPRATWGPLEAIGVWLVAYVVIGGAVVFPILAASMDIDIDDATGGADSDVLFLSAAIALVSTAVLLLWLRTRHPTWPRVMGLVGPGVLSDARWGAAAGLALYPIVALGVGTIVVVVLEALAGDSVATPEQLDAGLDVGGKVLAVVYGVGIAPFAEELFFRGVLFRALADRRGFWVGAIVSGLLFGIVHVPTGQQDVADTLVLPIVMTFTGIGLAWIYERRRSLLAPIAAHIVFNAIGLALIFSGVGG